MDFSRKKSSCMRKGGEEEGGKFFSVRGQEQTGGKSWRRKGKAEILLMKGGKRKGDQIVDGKGAGEKAFRMSCKEGRRPAQNGKKTPRGAVTKTGKKIFFAGGKDPTAGGEGGDEFVPPRKREGGRKKKKVASCGGGGEKGERKRRGLPTGRRGGRRKSVHIPLKESEKRRGGRLITIGCVGERREKKKKKGEGGFVMIGGEKKQRDFLHCLKTEPKQGKIGGEGAVSPRSVTKGGKKKKGRATCVLDKREKKERCYLLCDG